jgi:hypothetical protein
MYCECACISIQQMLCLAFEAMMGCLAILTAPILVRKSTTPCLTGAAVREVHGVRSAVGWAVCVAGSWVGLPLTAAKEAQCEVYVDRAASFFKVLGQLQMYAGSIVVNSVHCGFGTTCPTGTHNHSCATLTTAPAGDF